MGRKIRIVVACCAAMVGVVLSLGTAASADSGTGSGTDGTRVTGQHENSGALSPDTREG